MRGGLIERPKIPCLKRKHPVRLAINKKQNYFWLPDHQFAENLILVFGFYEGTKNG